MPRLSLDSVRLLEGGNVAPCGPIGSTAAFVVFQFPASACGTTMKPVQVNTVPPPLPVTAPGPLLRLANGQCDAKGCSDANVYSYYDAADYPVTKVLRDPVYVEVHILERTDPNIVLLLEHCWATPTSSPLSLPQWSLLVDGISGGIPHNCFCLQHKVPSMPGPPEHHELEEILEELCLSALRQQHLEERYAILLKQHEFMNKRNTEGSVRPSELDKIEKELEVLLKRKEELLQHKNTCIHRICQQTGGYIPTSKDGYDVPCTTENVIDIPDPPSKPAPQVITEVEALPHFPSLIQCPSCQEFITTKTFYRVGSTTWLMCLMSVIIGCVAGCCLIPFCLESAKDLEHRCPKCQKQIHIIERM
ncbi:hypothetical protein AAFF_G00081370 [Aldrovandia affinis]|uniref:LITAF domain-containing protein n=1 Tax=Aldrovandia affinis TaxID=143900 RepID=A0AAD7T3A9_9TELE|nr:hypothetical protein AAFF_G00081370 [Aldrovandia affinis]